MPDGGGTAKADLRPVLDALEEIVLLRDPLARRTLVQIIETELDGRLHVPEHPVARLHLIAILHACRQSPGGLRALAYALPLVAGEGSSPVRRALALLADVTVLEVIPEPERQALRTLLTDLDTPVELRSQLAAEGHRHAAAARRPDAWSAYECLEQANAGTDGLPPCLAFVERLASFVAADRGDRLRAWAEWQALSLNLLSELESLRASLASRPGDSTTFYLLIQIEPAGVASDRYLVSHWQQRDSRGWYPERGEDLLVPESDLERAVEKLVTRAEEDLRMFDGPMVVEFLLPRALLNLPVDHWVKESGSDRPVPLGVSYPVVVRSLARIRRMDWQGVWRQRGRRLRGVESVIERTVWSRPDGDGYLTRLEARFLTDPGLVSLVLSSPPLIPSTRLDEVDEVVLALRAGLPVVIWDRENCRQPAFRELVHRLLDGGATDVADLPERARRLRVQAAESRRRRPVTVLLDDPDRLPELDEPPGIPG